MEYNLSNILIKANSLSDLARMIFGKENYSNREKCKKILTENNVNWEEWLESKKVEEKRYCLYCGKELTDKNKNRKKFCNHSCAASYNNTGVSRNNSKSNDEVRHCLNCGKEIKRGHYCDNSCYSLYKQKEYIIKWKNKEESGLKGKYQIVSAVKKYIFEKNNYKCEKCGCNSINEYTGNSILQIHHIDGDCTNNSEENLQLLCPNCHAMTENYGSRNKNATRKDNRKRY